MTKASKVAIAIARYIHTFLTKYVPSQKSRSEHTLKGYTNAISLYIKFLETNKSVTIDKFDASCFEQKMIEEWLQWLSDSRNCSPGTCNNRLASIRVFLKYLGQQDISLLYLYESASNILRRKEFKKRISGLSKNGVKALLNAPDVTTVTGRRDLTLITTAYCTAARIDEVLSMKISHLNLDGKKPFITFIGKGSKIRTVPLLPKAVAHLQKYIKEQHGENPDRNAYVFYSRNTGSCGKLSQMAVSKRLRHLAAVAHRSCEDVPLDFHAHQLRHARASHWLDEGVNIVQISFLLGHASLETTMVYLDITTEQEITAMATLENENDKKVTKKWKSDNCSLAGFCGL